MTNTDKISLKKYVRYYYIDSNITFVSAGKTYTIQDETKYIYTVASFLEKPITVEALFSKLSVGYESMPIDNLLELLEEMDKYFLIESVYDSKQIFDKYYTERFDRNISFLDSYCNKGTNPYEIQSMIKNTKVVVLGLGGVGSHLLFDLVSLGVENITAVDFDKVELTNLNRQILYKEKDIGFSKINSAKKTIDDYYINNKVVFINKYIKTVDDICELIDGHDIALVSVDRPHNIYHLVNEACIKKNVKYITCTVLLNKSQLFTIIPNETGCVECWKKSVSETDKEQEKLIELQENDTLLDRSRMSAPVNLVAISVAFAINELIKIILPDSMFKPIYTNKVVTIPFETMMPEIVEEWKKHDDCKVCSSLEKK